jgi:hypothetical protein
VKRSSIVIVLVAAILLIGAAVIYFAHQWAPKEFGYRFDWPRGREYLYNLQYANTNKTSIFTGAGSGDASKQSFGAIVELDAELTLKSYGKRGELYLLGASLSSFGKHEITFMGQSLLPDKKAVEDVFSGQEGLLELRDTGEVERIFFAPGAPELFKNLVQNLAGELQVVVQSGARSWTATESNQNGRGPVGYREIDESVLEKERSGYDELFAVSVGLEKKEKEISAKYEVKLAQEGHVASIVGKERIDVRDRALGQVKAIVDRGGLTAQSHGALAGLLEMEARQGKEAEQKLAQQMISSLLAKDDLDPQIRYRIGQLLMK